jgi:hypothetical protein
MEYEQWVIIRFLFQEDSNANGDHIHRRPQAQFTDDAHSIPSVRRWYQFIRQGREDLHDDPRSGRLHIDFIGIKILSALEKEPFHSAHLLAEVVDTPSSTVIRHLRNLLRMKNVHLC